MHVVAKICAKGISDVCLFLKGPNNTFEVKPALRCQRNKLFNAQSEGVGLVQHTSHIKGAWPEWPIDGFSLEVASGVDVVLVIALVSEVITNCRARYQIDIAHRNLLPGAALR